jgi:hypothetical protein
MVGVKITMDPDRPWQEHWGFVLHHLAKIESAYAGEVGLGNVEVQARVNSFFVECDHLRDWLKGDVANLPGVSKSHIDDHFKKSIALQRCNAICNTHKHFKRSQTLKDKKKGKPMPMTARILSVNSDRGRYDVIVELDWFGPHAQRYDAKTLAKECVDSWHQFFRDHSIPEPTF